MNPLDWSNANIMITGGTGSFGRKFAEIVLREYHPKKLIVFSRDELKQEEMQLHGFRDPSLRFFLGDVRDRDRLRRAMNGVDIVVHAAALKQVPACEYNPIEAVLTNVMGARNVIDAALDCNVGAVMALSSDKAVSPVNLYGATKLVAEKLFTQANAYSGGGRTRFASVRYGNVLGSRGSVVPLFIRQRASGKITVTEPRMTRFWITLEQGVRFVIQSIERMHGGEVFVPKLPSASILELVKGLAPECSVQEIGIRPGEKLHECLVSEDEARNTREMDDFYVIQPAHKWWAGANWADGRALADGFRYTSDNNPVRLNNAQIQALVASVEGYQSTPAPVPPMNGAVMTSALAGTLR
ncbi:MAG TPA: UDP-N-acetylglucosamine 4,6-dehydratase (inverting) [Bryobacteraceae bacterium]|nr:UDP-N-acetylglucosamine 4,6-dehydratase (inverting) [Bryobacteraceae bacterium]